MNTILRKLSKNLWGVAVIAALTAVVAYLLARFLTHCLTYSDNAMMGIAYAIPTFVDALKAEPFRIAWSDPTVSVATFVIVAMSALTALGQLSRGMKMDNEDTQGAHGDDRLATKREMAVRMDTKHWWNNIRYLEGAGIILAPYDEKTKKKADAINLNSVVFGISGLGKTYNLVAYDIAQSVGAPFASGLVPARPGIANLPENLMRAPWAPDPIKAAAVAASKRARDMALLIPRKNDDDAMKRLGLGEGFDTFSTDPKGDDVRDCGGMLKAAGVLVKEVNTIDFKGLKYNPLVAIPERYVDSKDPSLIRTRATCGRLSVSADADCAREAFSKEERMTLGVRHNLVTATSGLNDVPTTAKSFTELDEKLWETLDGDTDFCLEDARVLRDQRDRAWMHEQMGSFVDGTDEKDRPIAHIGAGCEKVASTVEAFNYRRTSGKVEVRITCAPGFSANKVVEIDLDPALVVEGYTHPSCTSVEIAQNERGGRDTKAPIKWTIDKMPPPALPGERTTLVLTLDVHIAPTRVADGVHLTKTVDCLVANLRGTQAQARSDGSTDPFWEDCKRLCFMSLIALLFERYDAKYRTLPEMMRLLDLALPESGKEGDKSPLAVIFEEWEYARVFAPATGAKGRRGATRNQGKWVTASTPAHSRHDSMAVHCYHAFMDCAEDTRKSIIISCQTALVNLLSDDVREFLSADEVGLDTLGEEGSCQAIFVVTSDVPSPYDFLTALICFQAIDSCMERAFVKHGGKLPRHVRFILDELRNLGSIPILVRACAVVRSRNVSISMYLQSRAQLAAVYGQEGADTIIDCCSTVVYLGAQTESSREEISKMVGTETVASRTFQRSFGEAGAVRGSTESITTNERRVMSPSQLRRLKHGYALALMFGQHAMFGPKNQTARHPYYRYMYPGHAHTLFEPAPVFDERFDYERYLGDLRAGRITNLRMKEVGSMKT